MNRAGVLNFLTRAKKNEKRNAMQIKTGEVSVKFPIIKPRHQKISGKNKGELVNLVFTVNPDYVTIPKGITGYNFLKNFS